MFRKESSRHGKKVKQVTKKHKSIKKSTINILNVTIDKSACEGFCKKLKPFEYSSHPIKDILSYFKNHNDELKKFLIKGGDSALRYFDKLLGKAIQNHIIMVGNHYDKKRYDDLRYVYPTNERDANFHVAGANNILRAIAYMKVDYRQYKTLKNIFDSFKIRKNEWAKLKRKAKERGKRAMKTLNKKIAMEEKEFRKSIKMHPYTAVISSGYSIFCDYISKIRVNNTLHKCFTNTARTRIVIPLNTHFNLEVSMNPNYSNIGTIPKTYIKIINSSGKTVYSDSTTNGFKTFNVKN